MKYPTLVFLFGCLFLGQNAWSADPDVYSHTDKGAIGGADAVSYFSLEPGEDAVMGNLQYSHHYKGATWYFSSEKNLNLFVASPSTYEPQFGGYCAFAVSHGFTKSINPDYWHIVDGKLYLNYNFFADRKWRKNKEQAIANGHKNWPSALTACEAHDNCGNY